jgi:hypothetical protein
MKGVKNIPKGLVTIRPDVMRHLQVIIHPRVNIKEGMAIALKGSKGQDTLISYGIDCS